MSEVSNRDKVFEIADEWKKQGLVLTTICQRCNTSVSYIHNNLTKIGYIYALYVKESGCGNKVL